MGNAANGAGIAVVHTCFNVFATCVLLPFGKGLEKLACLTIRDKEEDMGVEENTTLLDPRFLEKPAFAMEHCMNVSAQMAEYSKQTLFTAMELLHNYTDEKAERVSKLEDFL